MAKRILLCAFASIFVAASTACFANVLVVRAAGPSAKNYPPGKLLPDSSKVALQSGDTLTLLHATSAQTLRGPGTFPVGGAGGQSLALAADRRMRFGAMRSGEIPQNPSPWNLDVTQSGRMCIADPAKLILWRPQSDSPATLTITANGESRQVKFGSGKATAAWPSGLKIAPGTEYRIQQDGNGDSSNVTFVTVKQAPSQLQSAARVLIDNGCDNQLDTLVAGASN